MIRIENFVGPSNDQWAAVIRGMRNPMNSWEKSDSGICEGEFVNTNEHASTTTSSRCKGCEYDGVFGYDASQPGCEALKGTVSVFRVGDRDMKLAKGLIAKGVADRKFLRQLPVIMDITAPMYWWRQMDKYQVGTVTDSCSTMHKLTEKEFEVSDFSLDAYCNSKDAGNSEVYEPLGWVAFHMLDWINGFREKYLETGDKVWWEALVQFLPQSYNQKRTWSANYEVLRTICRQREGHKLKEWTDFIEWVRENVPYAEELIF